MDDWSLLIVHYLGLNHTGCGHFPGHFLFVLLCYRHWLASVIYMVNHYRHGNQD